MSTPLGQFELLVLLAILTAPGERYGWSIQVALSYAGRHVSPGTIYRTLRRLERKRLVCSRFGPPERRSGGRRKRHYDITPAGLQAAERTLTILAKLLPRGLVLKRLRLRERASLGSPEAPENPF